MKNVETYIYLLKYCNKAGHEKIFRSQAAVIYENPILF